jgi:hypothetical protein
MSIARFAASEKDLRLTNTAWSIMDDDMRLDS